MGAFRFSVEMGRRNIEALTTPHRSWARTNTKAPSTPDGAFAGDQAEHGRTMTRMDAAEAEVEWVRVATEYNVPEDEWERQLLESEEQIQRHPVWTRGYNKWSLTAAKVSQGGKGPKGPLTEFTLPDRTVWPDRATNPAWWKPIDEAVKARAAARAAAIRRQADSQV